MIHLKEIDKDNWFDVVLLRSEEDQNNKIFERNIASNCFSLTQASMENEWITRAVYDDETLVGFAMFGYSKELKGYELCRFMIDYRFQGRGYGKEALNVAIGLMKARFKCSRIFVSFHPENTIAKNLYVSFGFADTGEIVKGFVDELVYALDA